MGSSLTLNAPDLSLTTELSPSEQKPRRFSGLDCCVAILAVCSVAAPFAARLQVDAHASGPQVAVRADVSPIRPIDLEMGYNERQAEAAFYQGLAQSPAAAKTDAALELALAAPVNAPPAVPLPATEKDAVAPAPALDIAVLGGIENRDFQPEADVSDTPPQKTAEEKPAPEPAVRVAMTLPPTMTPLPIRRAENEEADQAAVADNGAVDAPEPVQDDAVSLPKIASAGDDIEEAPLPPLAVSDESVAANITATPVPALDTRPIQTDVLPSDVTSMIPVKEEAVTAQLVSAAAPTPARPPVKLSNGPKVALVIAAAGINTNVTRFGIEALPAGVTLAFAPIRDEVTALAREAKNDGHTVLVEIPMEPVNKNRDPGPLTLRVGDSDADNLARLNKALGRVPDADGASSYLGARFNADARAATPVVRALAGKGLFLFENEPTSRSVFQRLSAGSNLPYVRGVVKIDRDRDVAAIRAALNRLEQQARRQGSAIGVGTALRGTISTVALWIKEAEKRGVQFVSVSELAR